MIYLLFLILLCQVAIIAQLRRIIKQGNFSTEDETVKHLGEELQEAQSNLPPRNSTTNQKEKLYHA